MPAGNDDQVTPEPATRRLGRFGEEAAAEVYRAAGYRVLARNWRCPAGELDLVVARGDVVAFCEVKTRAGRGFGGGYEAVGWRKQRKLRQLAELFLASAGLAPHVIRFDVASILAQRGRRPAVDLFEDAF
jgi:putative endonuclease